MLEMNFSWLHGIVLSLRLKQGTINNIVGRVKNTCYHHRNYHSKQFISLMKACTTANKILYMQRYLIVVLCTFGKHMIPFSVEGFQFSLFYQQVLCCLILLKVSIRILELLKAHPLNLFLHSFVYIVYGLGTATYAVCMESGYALVA